MPVTLYVLKGEPDGNRYVGITKDVERRLREHTAGRTKAGQMLRRFSVLYTGEHPDYAEARVRERFLKSGQGRKWPDELESQTRPAGGG